METDIPPLPTGLEESIYESNIGSLKIIWGLVGAAAAKKGDPNVREGNYPSSPKPDQALEGAQLNSTGSSSGDRVVRGWTNEIIGHDNSTNLVD